MLVFSLQALEQFLQKIYYLVCYFVWMFFPLTILLLWKIVSSLIISQVLCVSTLYFMICFWILKSFRFALSYFKRIFVFIIMCFDFSSSIYQKLIVWMLSFGWFWGKLNRSSCFSIIFVYNRFIVSILYFKNFLGRRQPKDLT